MKKLFLLYIIVAGGMGFNFSFAQVLQSSPAVGINTKDPQGPFHVDARGDTQGTSNTSDDVIVDKDGNLGIGTITPTTKVHIKTDGNINGIRISDETEAKGSMLMFQDNTGVVNWVPKPFTIVQVKEGDLNTDDYEMEGRNPDDHREISKTGKGLKLPPGVWMIMAKYMIENPGDDEGKLYWTYLHDLDDLSTLRAKGYPDATHLLDKRQPCMIDGALPENNCNNGGFNLSWYLASGGIGGNPSEHAMSVVGIYPEAKRWGFTTPYINHIAVIKPNKKDPNDPNSPYLKPGDPGYEHEIALTFSTSLGADKLLKSRSSIPGQGNNGEDLPVGVYFFAVRLDIDEASL